MKKNKFRNIEKYVSTFICLFLCIFTLTSCTYSKLNTIEYKQEFYSPVLYWYMNDEDSYFSDIAKESKGDVSVRLYEGDINCEFLYVEKYSLLYHVNSIVLPEWKSEDDVTCFLLESLTKDEISYVQGEKKKYLISEISSAISSKGEKISYKELQTAKEIINITCFFEKFPANFFLGKIVVRDDGSVGFLLNATNLYYRMGNNTGDGSVCSVEE